MSRDDAVGPERAGAAPVPDPRPAPGELETLRIFVNSDNRYHHVDYFAEPDRVERCARWFPGLPVDEVDPASWRRLVELRDAVRAVVARAPGATATITTVARRYPVAMAFELADDEHAARLVPTGSGQEAALAAAVLGALHTACQDGRFERLHLCARPDCGWCFYDTSRNRSARWCSSDPCGHVMKTRAYRERQRARA